MNISVPTAALAIALTMGFCFPAPAHMAGAAGMAAGSPSASARAGVGLQGFRYNFLPRPSPFHRPHVRFGGFGLNRVVPVTGGYGDYDYAEDEGYGPDAGDDIDNLHFRVQEPFGPGDIGRPALRARLAAPYDSERMERSHGDDAEEW